MHSAAVEKARLWRFVYPAVWLLDRKCACAVTRPLHASDGHTRRHGLMWFDDVLGRFLWLSRESEPMQHASHRHAKTSYAERFHISMQSNALSVWIGIFGWCHGGVEGTQSKGKATAHLSGQPLGAACRQTRRHASLKPHLCVIHLCLVFSQGTSQRPKPKSETLPLFLVLAVLNCCHSSLSIQARGGWILAFAFAFVSVSSSLATPGGERWCAHSDSFFFFSCCSLSLP